MTLLRFWRGPNYPFVSLGGYRQAKRKKRLTRKAGCSVTSSTLKWNTTKKPLILLSIMVAVSTFFLKILSTSSSFLLKNIQCLKKSAGWMILPYQCLIIISLDKHYMDTLWCDVVPIKGLSPTAWSALAIWLEGQVWCIYKLILIYVWKQEDNITALKYKIFRPIPVKAKSLHSGILLPPSKRRESSLLC